VNQVVTNVPNNLNRPQTFHVFNYLLQSGSLTAVPLTIALVGMKASSGTAVLGTIYDATDAATTDALFGIGSEAALMCRKSYECNVLFGRGPRVKVVSIAEPGGGAANVKTITCAGTATTDGNQKIRIAGRTYLVGVRSGDVAATNAAAIASVLKADQANLPVIVTVAGAVVTLTHATKGANGADIVVTVDFQVAGLTATAANTVAGTGVADCQPAIDALSPLRYDGIAIANHAAADITEINLDIAARWSASSKTWGWYFIGEMGSIGTATSLAAAANHQAVVVSSFEGCLNTAGEIATATAMLVWSRERPNANYDGATVPLFPPGAATVYTGPEVETAILAGLTAYTGVVDSTGQFTANRAKCERLVTTKTTTSSQPDARNRDIAVSRTGVALAIQLDIATGIALGADSNPDGVSQDEDTDDQIKDLAAAIMRSEAIAKVLVQSKVESDIAGIIVEHDTITSGRNNVLLPYTVAVNLHQIAWVHNIQIGG
jgi:phage tail sheath gpL-like